MAGNDQFNDDSNAAVDVRAYAGEAQMATIMALIDDELSEPYTIYTYRYFLNQWPSLCFLAYDCRDDGAEAEQQPIGVVIGKLDRHNKGARAMRGYIGMISVQRAARGRGIGTRLLKVVLAEMIRQGAQEVVLETECDNDASLRLYERLGFMREKRLFKFYLNGKDCFRLYLQIPIDHCQPQQPPLQPTRRPIRTQTPPPPLPPRAPPATTLQDIRISSSAYSPPAPHYTWSSSDIL